MDIEEGTGRTQRLIIKEALLRKIKVEKIDYLPDGGALFELSYKGHIEYVSKRFTSKTCTFAARCTSDKNLTKIFLRKAGLNMPRSKVFYKGEMKTALEFIDEIGYPVVIKMNNGEDGKNVFVGMDNAEESKKAIRKIIKTGDRFLVEKEFKGKEFRLLASRDKFIAATGRTPAYVLGDGKHNIRELVKAKFHHLEKVKIDYVLKEYLAKQGLDLEFVPAENHQVFIRKTASISTGGERIDVTDQVHPEIKKIAVKTVRAIPGLLYGGVDLISNQDISKKPTKNSYAIIEVNSWPGLELHHNLSFGKSRNVVKEIVDILFPETKK